MTPTKGNKQMSESKTKDCYGDLMQRLQNMEENIDMLIECVENLKNRHDDDDEEVCPDEIAADKIVQKVIEEICLDALLDVEPKGEA
jgi:NADH:ubiquinone oxidoreductase subunit D